MISRGNPDFSEVTYSAIDVTRLCFSIRLLCWTDFIPLAVDADSFGIDPAMMSHIKVVSPIARPDSVRVVGADQEANDLLFDR